MTFVTLASYVIKHILIYTHDQCKLGLFLEDDVQTPPLSLQKWPNPKFMSNVRKRVLKKQKKVVLLEVSGTFLNTKYFIPVLDFLTKNFYEVYYSASTFIQFIKKCMQLFFLKIFLNIWKNIDIKVREFFFLTIKKNCVRVAPPP